MKKYLRLAMIFSVILFLAACGGKEGSETSSTGGGTEEAAPKGNSVTTGKTGIFELEGEVSKINTISNTFVLVTKEGDVEVQVRAMSRLMLNGERVALAQVKSGSHAKGTFKKWNESDAAMELVITE